MGDQSRFYIDPDGLVQPAYPNTVLPPGTKVYSSREAAKSAIPPKTRNVGWMYSDRMVADYVYSENGKTFFLYDVSSVTGGSTYIMYEAVGLAPGDYASTWDADSLGNERNGPSLSTVLPDADIIRSTGETRLTMQNFTVARTPEGLKLGDWIGQTMEGLEQLYPFLYEEVEGRMPAIGLIFNSLTSGNPITNEQLTLAGVGKGFTTLKLDHLNATIASLDDNPGKYNVVVDGKLVTRTNQDYISLEKKVTTGIDTALGALGLNADVFKQDNVELYKALETSLVMGEIEIEQFENYLGHRLGIDGYKIAKDSNLYDVFKTVDTMVDNPGQFNAFVDFDTFKQSNLALSELKRVIGVGKFNTLDETEKNRLVGLYSRDTNAGMQEFQNIFDSDPMYERYADKGLNYGLVVGNYRDQYSSILGDKPDETSSIFMDSINMSYEDAKKSFLDYGYKTGNKKYMADLASSLSQSMGGVVIR